MAGKHSGDSPPAEVLFERRGRLGVVTLNRPNAVNALTAGMASAMLEQLTALGRRRRRGRRAGPRRR